MLSEVSNKYKVQSTKLLYVDDKTNKRIS